MKSSFTTAAARPVDAARESFEWHEDGELNEKARTFHNKYARQPRGIRKARGVHSKYMAEIVRFLRSRGCCSRIEYTGSTYEGVKVAKSSEDEDLEFDVMIIMKGGKQLTAVETTQPGFVQLTPRRKNEIARLPGLLSDHEGPYVDAQKLYNKFFGLIQTCVNESPEMSGKVRLVKHGPATQIDVYRHSDASGTTPIGAKFYSVDIVPAFDVGNGCIYVAKQKVKDQESRTLTSSWWRQSFSLAEKNKLGAADRDNGCRKQVFRILKVIRNRDTNTNLLPLTSYHLKTALFQEMDRAQSWTYLDVGKRLMGVLEILDRHLNVLKDGLKFMPHYFVPKINLLDGMSPETIDNVGSRTRDMRKSQIEMTNVLKYTKNKTKKKALNRPTAIRS